MQADRLFLRCSMVVHETADEAPLQFQRVGDRLLVITGTQYVETCRKALRLAGIAAAAAGIALAPLFAGGMALSLLGIAAIAAAPRKIRPRVLLEVDPKEDLLTPRGGAPVCLGGITHLHGRNDERGGVYALLDDGSDALIASFGPKQERRIEFACRTLAYLFDVPSEYTESYGAIQKSHSLNSRAALTRLGDLAADRRPQRQGRNPEAGAPLAAPTVQRRG